MTNQSDSIEIAALFARVSADVQEYAAGLSAVDRDLAMDGIAKGAAAAIQAASDMADWMPQVGDKYRVDFGKGHFANRLLHVRGIVDEEVVIRYWSKSKGWIYKCEPYWYFDPSESLHVSKVKSRKQAKNNDA